MSRKVLVTGGAGAIGSNLSRRLVEEGSQVVILDDLTSGREANVPEGAELIVGSVADQDKVASVLKDSFDEIYHLAAFFANQNSCDHPIDDFKANALGTLHILDAATRQKALKSLVFASTSSLKGDLDTGMAEGFSTPYMTSKFTGELYCRYYRRVHALPIRTVRYYNCYGPGEYPGRYRNVIINFIDSAHKGEPLPLTGDGSETRDFTFVEDIVSGTVAVARAKGTVGPIYQIGTGTETTIKTLADKIVKVCGSSSQVTLGERRD